jgi:hypothetical protein
LNYVCRLLIQILISFLVHTIESLPAASEAASSVLQKRSDLEGSGHRVAIVPFLNTMVY